MADLDLVGLLDVGNLIEFKDRLEGCIEPDSGALPKASVGLPFEIDGLLLSPDGAVEFWGIVLGTTFEADCWFVGRLVPWFVGWVGAWLDAGFSGLSLRKAAVMKDYSIFLCFIKRNHYVFIWNWWIQRYKPKKDVIRKKMKVLEFFI